MNGVSHMIPVVVSGGILFAIAAMLSMNSVQTSASVSSAGLAGFLINVGALGVYDNAAWGELVVLPVASVGLYLLCTAIGVAIYVALCAIFKKDYVEKEEVIEDIDISFE